MKKNLKFVLMYLALFLFSGAAFYYVARPFLKSKIRIIPYPYEFTEKYQKRIALELKDQIIEAENSQVLIIGDQMGKSLTPYLPTLAEHFNKTKTRPPIVYNWSSEHEGLFRSLSKIKLLKKIPPIIIYFGASSELYEKRFEVKDGNKILENFKTYENDSIISLIITFPWLSKYFYSPVSYLNIEDIKPYKNLISSTQKLEELEIGFKMFQYELKELIDIVKNKKTQIIFITTPINPDVPPKKVCQHANNDEIHIMQKEIQALIEKNEFKEAFPKIDMLAKTTFVNAKSYYLLGKAALGIGQLNIARDAFIKASVFDCQSWRGNGVYNAIIKNEAKAHFNSLVDFEQYMYSQLSKDGLFFDDLYPQNIFYQSIVKELAEVISQLLSIEQN